MQNLKRRPNIRTDLDIEISQDKDLKSAFDFWVRSVYLNRPSPPQVTSCESLASKDEQEPRTANS